MEANVTSFKRVMSFALTSVASYIQSKNTKVVCWKCIVILYYHRVIFNGVSTEFVSLLVTQVFFFFFLVRRILIGSQICRRNEILRHCCSYVRQNFLLAGSTIQGRQLVYISLFTTIDFACTWSLLPRQNILLCKSIVFHIFAIVHDNRYC